MAKVPKGKHCVVGEIGLRLWSVGRWFGSNMVCLRQLASRRVRAYKSRCFRPSPLVSSPLPPPVFFIYLPYIHPSTHGSPV
jgi:hypothetical protein